MTIQSVMQQLPTIIAPAVSNATLNLAGKSLPVFPVEVSLTQGLGGTVAGGAGILAGNAISSKFENTMVKVAALAVALLAANLATTNLVLSKLPETVTAWTGTGIELQAALLNTVITTALYSVLNYINQGPNEGQAKLELDNAEKALAAAKKAVADAEGDVTDAQTQAVKNAEKAVTEAKQAYDAIIAAKEEKTTERKEPRASEGEGA